MKKKKKGNAKNILKLTVQMKEFVLVKWEGGRVYHQYVYSMTFVAGFLLKKNRLNLFLGLFFCYRSVRVHSQIEC